MKRRDKVLITNGARRKAGPILRSLGRAGIQVDVTDSSAMPAVRLSRYCNRFLQCPDPARLPGAFSEWLQTLLRNEKYDAVFPLDEDVIEAILRDREEFEQLTKIPLPNMESYTIARNKNLMAETARKFGVLTPQTWIPLSREELDDLSQSLPYPVIVKARASSGSRGIRRAASPVDLRQTWRDIDERFPLPIVQELIPDGGEAYGISALFNARSEPRAIFSYRRLREYPLSGGPSTLREAVRETELETQTISLLQRLNWFGVAMAEYKTDPRTNTAYLLEINPRFWGSIALAIHAGVDFPILLFRMLVEGDIEPVVDYDIGARCRWLIGDLLHFLSIRPRAFGALQFIRSLNSHTAVDELTLDDPCMGLGYVLSGAYQFFGDPKFRALLRGNR